MVQKNSRPPVQKQRLFSLKYNESLEATLWSELPFLYLYYKTILVYLSIMISQCFSCIFLFIYIQSYWNAPEHIAVADEKDVR